MAYWVCVMWSVAQVVCVRWCIWHVCVACGVSEVACGVSEVACGVSEVACGVCQRCYVWHVICGM